MADESQRAATLNRTGVEAFERGDAAGAMRAFREALLLAPGDPGASGNLGVILAEGGDFLGALPHLTLAFQATQDNPNVVLSLVRALMGLREAEAARTVYYTYLANCPSDEVVGPLLAPEPWSVEIDPTLSPLLVFPGTAERVRTTYRETFFRCFEFLAANHIHGDVLEFGTFRGFTARVMASLMGQLEVPGDLCLFDSFEGLPELRSRVDLGGYEAAETRVWFKGQMALPGGIEILIARALGCILPPARIHITKGFFEETVPSTLPPGSAALVHLDCDLYESTRHVLTHLLAQGRLQDGTVLAFDDFNCGRANPELGQRKALSDAFGGQARYRYSPFFSYGWHGHAFFVHDGSRGE